jgi:hypothetical protein
MSKKIRSLISEIDKKYKESEEVRSYFNYNDPIYLLISFICFYLLIFILIMKVIHNIYSN